jgi:hypothetical protein
VRGIAVLTISANTDSDQSPAVFNVFNVSNGGKRCEKCRETVSLSVRTGEDDAIVAGFLACSPSIAACYLGSSKNPVCYMTPGIFSSPVRPACLGEIAESGVRNLDLSSALWQLLRLL